ncbi:MAG: hypothetical protein AAF713_11785 [Pseudomonadota bacterium]
MTSGGLETDEGLNPEMLKIQGAETPLEGERAAKITEPEPERELFYVR